MPQSSQPTHSPQRDHDSRGGQRIIRAIRARARRALREPARSRASLETLALLCAAGAFVVGLAVNGMLFWGDSLSISGRGSVGTHAAVGGAVVAALAFALARIAVRPASDDPDAPRDGFAGPADRLRWYDLIAIGAAYAAVALLGWLGISLLIERSFIGAPVYPFPGAVLVAVAYALTAYVAFLGSAGMTPMSLSLDLAVFLVVGAFAAMLGSSEPQWWQDNLSALGMTTNAAAPAFNITLVIAGVIVTTIARYATAGLPIDEPRERRGRTLTRGGLVAVGVLLAAVGLIPVDVSLLLHNSVATGMALVFMVLVCALPRLLPTLPPVFYALGYVYVAVIVLLGVFFFTGYYNLTAVELIAAALVFSWIIVFLRTATASDRRR